MVPDGFERWWFDPGEHPYAHEANLFLSISEDNLKTSLPFNYYTTSLKLV